MSQHQEAIKVKKMLKILLWTGIFIIALLAFLGVKAAFTEFVPKNYTEHVKTGGSIEAEYLRMGTYEVSHLERR